jgi:hypothetical protein
LFSADSTSTSPKKASFDQVRIEDLANVKLSEKQKKPAQPYLTSNDIHSFNEKTKPIKVFSKLITKHDKEQEQVNHKHASSSIYSNKKIQVRAENEQAESSKFKPESSKLQRTNGHTGQSKTSLAYFASAGLRSFPSLFKSTPTTFDDISKSTSATFEAAGPYTTRVNFQGPLFQTENTNKKTLVQPQAPKSFYYRTEVQMQPQTSLFRRMPLMNSSPVYNVPYHFPTTYYNHQPYQIYPQMNPGYFK